MRSINAAISLACFSVSPCRIRAASTTSSLPCFPRSSGSVYYPISDVLNCNVDKLAKDVDKLEDAREARGMVPVDAIILAAGGFQLSADTFFCGVDRH